MKRRSLDIRQGTEGPAHDPYSFTEYTVSINNKTVVAHQGLATFLTVNGHQMKFRQKPMRWDKKLNKHVDDLTPAIERRFVELTGLTPDQVHRYYNRIHRDDIPDPMGSPSDYI